MTKKNKERLYKKFDKMSNEELEKEYNETFWECLGSDAELMCEYGYDEADIKDSEEHKKHVIEYNDLICKYLKEERNIDEYKKMEEEWNVKG